MKLNHPTLPGVSKSVPDAIAKRWLENGWTEAAETKPAPAPVKRAAVKKS